MSTRNDATRYGTWYCTTCGMGQHGMPHACRGCRSTELLGVGIVLTAPCTIEAATKIVLVEDGGEETAATDYFARQLPENDGAE